jgi:uncharacterized membrane-anchored protein YhcB (DUF1043 family)
MTKILIGLACLALLPVAIWTIVRTLALVVALVCYVIAGVMWLRFTPEDREEYRRQQRLQAIQDNLRRMK